MKTMDNKKVRLHILTPIHIGCGQQVDPFSYVLKDRDLLLIDLVSWIADFDRQDELYAVLEGGDYNKVIGFISKRFNSDEAVLDRIPIVSKKFVQDYYNATSGRQTKQRALLNLMMRTPVRQRAIIPGSAIKGSIRTALGSYFAGRYGLNPSDCTNCRYDKKIFGQIQRDPMKYLKIGDIELPQAGTAIFEAKEHAAKKKLTPKGNFEASISLCTTGEDVALELPFQLNTGKLKIKGRAVDERFLIDVLNGFFQPKFNREYTKFYDHGRANDIKEALGPAFQAIAGMKTNMALIRIGRFSHVECMTYDRFRKPKAKKGWGKTRTLAEGLLPFGWALLEFRELEGKKPRERKWPFRVDESKTRVLPHPLFRQQGNQFQTGGPGNGEPVPSKKKEPPKTETWEDAWITWSPGNQEVTARAGDKSATGKGKDLVPESMRRRVIDRRRAQTASRVKVEAVGNRWKIISITS